MLRHHLQRIPRQFPGDVGRVYYPKGGHIPKRFLAFFQSQRIWPRKARLFFVRNIRGRSQEWLDHKSISVSISIHPSPRVPPTSQHQVSVRKTFQLRFPSTTQRAHTFLGDGRCARIHSRIRLNLKHHFSSYGLECHQSHFPRDRSHLKRMNSGILARVHPLTSPQDNTLHIFPGGHPSRLLQRSTCIGKLRLSKAIR